MTGIYLFLMVLKTGEFNDKMFADTVPSEDSLPGLQMTTLSLSSHGGGRALGPHPPLIVPLIPL